MLSVALLWLKNLNTCLHMEASITEQSVRVLKLLIDLTLGDEAVSEPAHLYFLN